MSALLGGLLVLFGAAQSASPLGPWTPDDTRAALVGAPAIVACIVERESSFNPYAIGAAGEQGVAQLLPSWRGGGQWDTFMYSAEWSPLDPSLRSPYNPYQSVAFLEWWGARHGYSAWSTARFC